MNGMIPRQANLENKIRKWRGVEDVFFTKDDSVVVTLNDWSMKPVVMLWLNTLFDKRGIELDNISFLLEPPAVSRQRVPMMRRFR